MRSLLLILTIIALTSIAFSFEFPMKDGVVQLSKVNMSDYPTLFQADGWPMDLAAVGPTVGMLAFARDNVADGKPMGEPTDRPTLRLGGNWK